MNTNAHVFGDWRLGAIMLALWALAIGIIMVRQIRGK
jgi:hypothetical protein